MFTPTTTIAIINEAGDGLTLHRSWTANTLSPDELDDRVGVDRSGTAVLRFERPELHASESPATFTTAFTFDGVSIELQERIYRDGPISTTMWQSMTAGSVTTGFINTNKDHTIEFTGESGATYSLRWTLSGVGHKDITYTFVQTKPAYRTTKPVMTQIDTIVFMMFENRRGVSMRLNDQSNVGRAAGKSASIQTAGPSCLHR